MRNTIRNTLRFNRNVTNQKLQRRAKPKGRGTRRGQAATANNPINNVKEQRARNAPTRERKINDSY
jgi:hypothetical protein